ncbi:hypothetical protein [uncultured Roseibium sp.]|uniref:hypothetical protein n=1 Tax=uncultured Roseibium sp. TaxID=1936171 RepID=UPI003217B8AC
MTQLSNLHRRDSTGSHVDQNALRTQVRGGRTAAGHHYVTLKQNFPIEKFYAFPSILNSQCLIPEDGFFPINLPSLDINHYFRIWPKQMAKTQEGNLWT